MKAPVVLDKILGHAPLFNGQGVISSGLEVPGGAIVSRVTFDRRGVVLADCMCFVPGVVLRNTGHHGEIAGVRVPIYALAREVLS